VAVRLMAVDPLGSRVRDELGRHLGLARPLQTALVSAVSLAVGAALPLGLTVLALMGSDTGDGADGQLVGAGGR
jgi:hypothetical protein